MEHSFHKHYHRIDQERYFKITVHKENCLANQQNQLGQVSKFQAHNVWNSQDLFLHIETFELESKTSLDLLGFSFSGITITSDWSVYKYFLISATGKLSSAPKDKSVHFYVCCSEKHSYWARMSYFAPLLLVCTAVDTLILLGWLMSKFLDWLIDFKGLEG